MEQTERIALMEQLFDSSVNAVHRLSAALDEYEAAQGAISELTDYYSSEEWRNDFNADEQGLLLKDLKRGVLSEDGVWNLLEDCSALNARMLEVAEKLRKMRD